MQSNRRPIPFVAGFVFLAAAIVLTAIAVACVGPQLDMPITREQSQRLGRMMIASIILAAVSAICGNVVIDIGLPRPAKQLWRIVRFSMLTLASMVCGWIAGFFLFACNESAWTRLVLHL